MRRIVLILPLLVLTQCVAPSAPPPGPPPPPPAPVAAPVPVAPRPVGDWRDWPVTPGTWRYAQEGQGSVASFGAAGAAPLLTLRCDRARRQVTLTRTGSAAAGSALTVRTSSTSRTLPVTAGTGTVAAALPAQDSLLDAMGFSRGRFIVDLPGQTALVVPAWAEVLRLTEDCRS
ncbi:hypothetical protein LK533_03870 [Sphingomonas sp. PL-96]|uniref:hypothetical protein n=1 Tax=Sphingomonas sp. PL-96 TaxID=2887201 RepID=UPI001E4B62EA|nr:hypothetical protein [Sphingomonas sp. PL-96]MCC2975814.1 hypothetical protein [Sphingomonas sp. PL-96]